MTVKSPIVSAVRADDLAPEDASTSGNSEASKSDPLIAWMHALVGQIRSDSPDLTNRQMALLLVVYLNDDQHTVRSLAQRLQVGKPIISRALDTLGGLGYVRRRRGIGDRRDVFVERTSDGAAFLASFASLVKIASG